MLVCRRRHHGEAEASTSRSELGRGKDGKPLGVGITAEGVETQRQVDLLCGEGCNEMQGYLFSRPPAGKPDPLLSGFPQRERAVRRGGARRASVRHRSAKGLSR